MIPTSQGILVVKNMYMYWGFILCVILLYIYLQKLHMPVTVVERKKILTFANTRYITAVIIATVLKKPDL